MTYPWHDNKFWKKPTVKLDESHTNYGSNPKITRDEIVEKITEASIELYIAEKGLTMTSNRDQTAYNIYTEARKIWKEVLKQHDKIRDNDD